MFFWLTFFVIWYVVTAGCKFYCSKFFSFSWFLLLIFINLQWTIDTSPIIYPLCSLHYERIFLMKVESFVFFYIAFFVCMFCVNIIIIKNLSLSAFRVLGSKFFNFLMSILKQQVSSSSNFASFFSVKKDSSSVIF